jgi:UDP-GlcNAc:undecaprenyl-phosphate/decaprenyl-phosphate GlcNAc-1-phosphate transferase
MTARVLAFNFLDGSDGLAAGTSAVIAIAYILLPGTALTAAGYAFASSLLGACIGFLVFNFPPAKIFMGDSGSTLLGFSIAFLGLDFVATKSATEMNTRNVFLTFTPLLFPMLVAAIPLIDAMLVVLNRLRNGRSPFNGDREHFYDHLLAAGWTPKWLVVACCVETLLLGRIGWLAMRTAFKPGGILAIVTVAVLLAAGRRLCSNQPRRSLARFEPEHKT